MLSKDRIAEDMHVHSTFSDGKGTIADNVAVALRLGLRRMVCVDHVRMDSTYLPDFAAAVRQVRGAVPIYVGLGVEAKILDGQGRLDVPDALPAVDYIYAADHQFPLGDRCYKPSEIRSMLASGQYTREAVIAALLGATQLAVQRYSRVVVAHLFSILPKVGIDELEVPQARLIELAEAMRYHGAAIEIDERWRCPGVRTLRAFHQAGVPIFLSTDSHKPSTIGQYEFVSAVCRELGV